MHSPNVDAIINNYFTAAWSFSHSFWSITPHPSLLIPYLGVLPLLPVYHAIVVEI